jgi:hypothetical protein
MEKCHRSRGRRKQYGLDADTRMVVYYPHKQASSGGMYLVARTIVAPESVGSAIVREVHALDSEAAVYDVMTMKDRLSDSLARRRFSTVMLSAFCLFRSGSGGDRSLRDPVIHGQPGRP